MALTRRHLAGVLGAAAGAALLDTRWSRAAAAPVRRRSSDDVLLNSNENPYGPSARALEAAASSGHVANRYPDGLEEDVRVAIAGHHGVKPTQIALGCG